MKKIITYCTILLFSVTLFSCGSALTGREMDILTMGSWQLETINGKPAANEGFANGLPVANFSKDLKITGNNGCNRYGGSYNLNDESGISISKLFSTKMFCNGKSEKEFMDALAAVDVAMISADKLVLMKDVQEVLVFKHLSETEQASATE